jgi:hypothetical protein
MLIVSYDAGELLEQILSTGDDRDDMVIRVTSTDAGLELTIGTVQPGDETFAHAERTVLVIDAQTSERLANKKLNVEIIDDEPELILVDQQGMD